MITRDIAVNATYGTIFYHKTLKNADGSPLRARVNGKCRRLKRDPHYFRLPMKYGLRDCFYIDNNNAHEFMTEEEANHWRELLTESRGY